jgi:RimJ/RimL family protein N-acetyltransferase
MTASPMVQTRLVTAAQDDLEDVLCVLSDAARWLISRGIDNQWPPVFEETDHRADKLRAEAAKGNVKIVYWDHHPLATVTLTDWADPDFAQGWPDGPGEALYVMRLATTQLARNLGLQLGHELLDHARFVAGTRGLPKIRLDCSKANVGLHDYYVSEGFERVGTVHAPGRRSGALFEWRYDPLWRERASTS